MIPVITIAHNDALTLSDDFHRQAKCLTQPFWDTLVSGEYLREVVATEKGLFLYPLHEPQRLLNFFDGYADLKFSRQRDESGLYQWVTIFDEYNIQLWIIANENVDLTGTIIE